MFTLCGTLPPRLRAFNAWVRPTAAMYDANPRGKGDFTIHASGVEVVTFGPMAKAPALACSNMIGSD
jgi:hypothetical protein